MNYDWQTPISQEGRKGWERAHYLPVSAATDTLQPALCGKIFNPGFATEAGKMARCFNCERRLR